MVAQIKWYSVMTVYIAESREDIFQKGGQFADLACRYSAWDRMAAMQMVTQPSF